MLPLFFTKKQPENISVFRLFQTIFIKTLRGVGNGYRSFLIKCGLIHCHPLLLHGLPLHS